ncbi:MAG: ribonuclease D [Proteobacteria bacterium]|nr:ribonuclease D [Pseudomonadota bacterium]
MTINAHYHQYDLPAGLDLGASIAIDTEAMGLNNIRDRLCVVQLSAGDGQVHIVHFPQKVYNKSPNLVKLLADKSKLKIFHFARFDVAILQYYFNLEIENLYCTKIVSRLSRTYTDQHSLKELCSEILGVKISKQQRTSDWGAEKLTREQLEYASHDVLYLHKLKEHLDILLQREGRTQLAQRCFEFIPARAQLDILGWADDILSH